MEPRSTWTRLPTSPYAPLLESNAQPSDHDAGIIHQWISNAETSIELFDAEVLRLRGTLAQVTASRQEFVEFAQSHRRMVSAVRRLPPDVLRLIFIEGVASERELAHDGDAYSDGLSELTDSSAISHDSLSVSEDSHGSDAPFILRRRASNTSEEEWPDDNSNDGTYDSDAVVPDVYHEVRHYRDMATYESDHGTDERDRRVVPLSPWMLAQICRSWRSVVLSSPSIWRYVSVDLGLQRRNTLLLAKELKFAGNSLLSLKLSSFEDNADARTSIDLIAAHSERWEEVELCVPASLLQYLREVTGAPFLSCLKRLTIAISQPSLPVPEIDAFANAPQLKTFSSLIRRPQEHASIPLERLTLPWSQLTDCAMNLIAVDHLSLLQKLRQVTEYKMTIIDDDHVSLAGSTLIELPFLRSLHIAATEPSQYTILYCIAAPLLKVFTAVYLRADYRPFTSETPIAPLRAFLLATPCRVAKFLATGHTENGDLLITTQVLETMSAVEELAVGSRNQVLDLSSLVYTPSQSPPLLPKLRSLTLRTTSMKLDSVLDIVESRWCLEENSDIGSSHVARLQACSIEDWTFSWTDTETLTRIRALREAGMDIRVWTVKEAWL